jgi:hypothetical protein
MRLRTLTQQTPDRGSAYAEYDGRGKPVDSAVNGTIML